MSVRSFAYRYSPRIARFLGMTYSPSIFDRYSYFPAIGRATKFTYAPTVSVGNTYAPANGRVSFNSYSPSYSDRLRFTPYTRIEYDNTFTPFNDRKLTYSPRVKSNDNYNPFISLNKKKIFAPFDYYDFKKNLDYSPIDIDVRIPRIIIDDSPLRYLAEYNRQLVNLLKVM